MAHEVRFDETFAAPRARIFAFFADHAKLGRLWGGRFTRIRDATQGSDRNGLGSVREIRTAGLVFEETIVAFQPDELIEYTVSRGSPIRDHLGRIEFSDAPGGATRVVYTIRFEPKIPLTGGFIALILRAGWKKGAPQVMRNLA